MATQKGAGGSNYPDITWGTSTGVGALGRSLGRGNTLDPRKRCAPPVGAGIGPKKRRGRKAPSSVTPW